MKKVLGIWALILLAAASAAAQVNVRGQLLLPGGGPPSERIRFYLTRDDGALNFYDFTDSNGRFILPRLSGNTSHTLFISGDGITYGDTSYTFIPSIDSAPRITLNPPPSKPSSPAATVSAASGYKPAADVLALYDRALSEIKANRPETAEPMLRKLTAQDPKFAGPFNDLAVILMQRKQYAEAESVLRQGLVADPKLLHAQLNLGITLNHLGKFGEAIEPLREALRLSPGMVAGHQQLGVALVEVEQFPEAEAELQRALKSPEANQALCQLYLGKLYSRTGAFPKAIEAFKAYLEKAPNSPNAPMVRTLLEQLEQKVAARPD